MIKTPSENVDKQLSTSLKERLKRCGRYHVPSLSSPVAALLPSGSLEVTSLQTAGVCPSSQCVSMCPGAQHICPTGARYFDRRIDVDQNRQHDHVSTIDAEMPMPSAEDGDSLKSTEKTKWMPLIPRSRTFVSKMKIAKLEFDKENCAKYVTDIGENATGNSNLSQSCNNVLTPTDREIIAAAGMGGQLHKSENETVKYRLNIELKAKEELLRKLKMVETYRSKNNITELQSLIDKWRTVTQQALQDLHNEMPEPRPSLTDLINHFGIDHKLVQFNSEDETFI